jgi:hypothetical protein
MMPPSKASNDDIRKDEDNHTPNFKAVVRDIQNRGSHRLSMAMTKSHHFCEFFGMSMCILEILWCSTSSQRVVTQSF